MNFCYSLMLLNQTNVLASDRRAFSALPLIVPIAADGVQRATVVLDSYSYQPDHLIVEAGKPVELTLTSVTTITRTTLSSKTSRPAVSVEQDVSAGKTVTVHLRRLSRAPFPFSATNASGRCPAIATKGWKASWKCNKVFPTSTALSKHELLRESPQTSVPSVLHDLGRRSGRCARSSQPRLPVCPCGRHHCRYGVDRSSASAWIYSPAQSQFVERSDCVGADSGDPAGHGTTPKNSAERILLERLEDCFRFFQTFSPDDRRGSSGS